MVPDHTDLIVRTDSRSCTGFCVYRSSHKVLTSSPEQLPLPWPALTMLRPGPSHLGPVFLKELREKVDVV